MSLQAITLDAAGTLIHLRKPVGETYSEIAAKFEIHTSPAAIESAFRNVWERTPAPFSAEFSNHPKTNQQGLKRENHLEREWWKALVHKVFAEAGASHGVQFDAFFTKLYDHFENPDCWQLDPDAAAVLQHIAVRGLKLGLLSNFDYRLRKILTGHDIFHHFQAVVLSGEIQASKPDPRMFATIQQALEVEDPSTILHIGDDPECDIAGAEQFGFQTFRVKLGKIPLKAVIKHLG